MEDERKRVLVEVVGPNPVSPDDVQLAQQQLNSTLNESVELNFWYKSEYVATSQGYTTYQELAAPGATERGRHLRKVFASELTSVQP